jgi:hypothetical protein
MDDSDKYDEYLTKNPAILQNVRSLAWCTSNKWAGSDRLAEIVGK